MTLHKGDGFKDCTLTFVTLHGENPHIMVCVMHSHSVMAKLGGCTVERPYSIVNRAAKHGGRTMREAVYFVAEQGYDMLKFFFGNAIFGCTF